MLVEQSLDISGANLMQFLGLGTHLRDASAFVTVRCPETLGTISESSRVASERGDNR